MAPYPKELRPGLWDRLQEIGTDKWTQENPEPILLVAETSISADAHGDPQKTVALTDAGSKWGGPRDMLVVTAVVRDEGGELGDGRSDTAHRSAHAPIVKLGSLMRLRDYDITVTQYERFSRLHLQIHDYDVLGNWDKISEQKLVLKAHPVTYPIQVQLPPSGKKKGRRGILC
eukprot:GHVN01056336.1.p1 GENE.GHVN01056336.1~~GHVN01056336.1.p1  ORF type:complete len:173 (-),score=14.10 GHVN01056336.1:191-709(-)